MLNDTSLTKAELLWPSWGLICRCMKPFHIQTDKQQTGPVNYSAKAKFMINRSTQRWEALLASTRGSILASSWFHLLLRMVMPPQLCLQRQVHRRERLTGSGSGSGGMTLITTKMSTCYPPVRTVLLITALMLNTNLSISLPRIPSDSHQRPITNVTVTIYAAMLQGILTFRESVLSCIHFHLQ